MDQEAIRRKLMDSEAELILGDQSPSSAKYI